MPQPEKGKRGRINSWLAFSCNLGLMTRDLKLYASGQ
jgi:hypothetical protein